MRTSLTDTMKERLLRGVEKAQARGASAAKITFGHSESRSCSFESGRLKSSGSRESVSYSVTVVLDGRRGVAGGNRLDEVDLMVDRALDLARAGSVAHFTAYPAPAPYTRVRKHSEKTLTLTREQMIDSGSRIVSRIKAFDPELDIHASGSVAEHEGLMVTDAGVCHESRSTSWGMGGWVQRTRGTDMLFAGMGRNWCELNEFYDRDVICDRIEEDLRRAETIVEAPSGPIAVYLPPESAGMFLMPVLSGLNGRSVHKGTSPLRGHLGEAYFAPNLTVTDTPHIDFAPAAAELDSSGIPTRETVLIDGGVIRTFLYDLDSAGLAGTEPTGHSGCSPYFPIVTPGPDPAEALLAEIDDGLYVKSLIGFGQSNMANGDFSSNVALGYRVRNGKIEGRVKNVMIAGNIYELLRRDVRLSSDTDPVSRLPHLVVRGVNASAAQG